MEEGAHHIVQAGRIAGGAGDTVSGLPIARLPELAGNRIPTSRQSASARARPAPGSRDGSIRSRLLVGVRLPVADGLGLGNEGLGARQPATEVWPPRVSGLSTGGMRSVLLCARDRPLRWQRTGDGRRMRIGLSRRIRATAVFGFSRGPLLTAASRRPGQGRGTRARWAGPLPRPARMRQRPRYTACMSFTSAAFSDCSCR